MPCPSTNWVLAYKVFLYLQSAVTKFCVWEVTVSQLTLLHEVPSEGATYRGENI